MHTRTLKRLSLLDANQIKRSIYVTRHDHSTLQINFRIIQWCTRFVFLVCDNNDSDSLRANSASSIAILIVIEGGPLSNETQCTLNRYSIINGLLLIGTGHGHTRAGATGHGKRRGRHIETTAVDSITTAMHVGRAGAPLEGEKCDGENCSSKDAGTLSLTL